MSSVMCKQIFRNRAHSFGFVNISEKEIYLVSLLFNCMLSRFEIYILNNVTTCSSVSKEESNCPIQHLVWGEE